MLAWARESTIMESPMRNRALVCALLIGASTALAAPRVYGVPAKTRMWYRDMTPDYTIIDHSDPEELDKAPVNAIMDENNHAIVAPDDFDEQDIPTDSEFASDGLDEEDDEADCENHCTSGVAPTLPPVPLGLTDAPVPSSWWSRSSLLSMQSSSSYFPP